MAGIKLVVIHPFGDYSRGDEIADDKTIASVLDGENASFVNKVATQAAVPINTVDAQ